jgi:Zn-dependent peptidase ImmA (M78 family)/transcriptional regulator with XRE-family HTH domain
MNEDPKQTFGHRLRQARTMMGWSLRQLSEAVQSQVSHNALAKYERAEMMPGSAVLIALAEALQQPVDFFFRSFTLELRHVRFRRKSRLSTKVAGAIHEQAVDYFERYFEIEQITGEARKFTGRLDSLMVTTPDEAEVAAEKLRSHWELGVDPIPNIVELAEYHGIKVFEAPTDDRGFDGFSAQTEAGPIIVLASWLNANLLRKRMTATHELGHVVLSLPEDLTEKAEEEIMRRFAGAFLLPRAAFIAAFGTNRSNVSLEELIVMKCLFGASIMAIMKRAHQLGLISDHAANAFWRHPDVHRWRAEKKEEGDERYSGQEQYSRFRQLVLRAAAEERISLSKGASLLGKPLGEFRHALRNVFS